MYDRILQCPLAIRDHWKHNTASIVIQVRISTQSLPALVSRGRKVQKSNSGGTALNGFSSGSRSGSRSESPTTPAEAEIVVTYDQTATQEAIPVRGRRRDRKSNFGDAQPSGLDVVQEV